MKLYLSYLAARERESGRTVFLAEVSHLSGGGECAVVAHVHELIRGPSADGFAMREKYSHALFVVDNIERASYAFPDPAIEKRKQLEAQLAEARRASDEAARSFDAAKRAAAAAKAATQGKTDASDRVRDLEKQLAALQSTATEKSKGGEPVGVIADLLKLTDDELAKAAVEYKVERKQGQPREDFAREIAKAAGYKVD